MAHTVHPAPVSFSEVPAHTAIAPTEPALRVLLDIPSDLPLVQWQIAPLTQVSRRLVGCVWQIVGYLVPITEDLPEYPCMQFSDLRIRLQVWLWRVFKPPPHYLYPRPMPLGWNRPWGDLRWHPDRGRWIALELLPSDGPDVARRVLGWVRASGHHAGGHHRRRALEDAVRLQVVCTMIRRSTDHGGPTTIGWIARLLNAENQNLGEWSAARARRKDRSVERSLERWCGRLGLTWDEVVQRALSENN